MHIRASKQKGMHKRPVKGAKHVDIKYNSKMPQDSKLHISLSDIVHAYLSTHKATKRKDKVYEIINKAYVLSEKAHRGQIRKDNTPYITHPVEVAYEVALLGFNLDAVISALLHDVVEDTDVRLSEIRRLFGDKVADTVDILTKPKTWLHASGRIMFVYPNDYRYYRKASNGWRIATGKEKRRHFEEMINSYYGRISNSGNLNAVVIKIFDALSNLRGIGYLPEWKMRRNVHVMMENVFPIAARILTHEKFEEIKEELRAHGFEMPGKKMPKHPRSKIVILQSREEIIKGNLENLPPPTPDYVSVYAGENLKHNRIEIGLSKSFYTIKPRIIEYIQDEFSRSGFYLKHVKQRKSMLPSRMGAHELIFEIEFKKGNMPNMEKIRSIVKEIYRKIVNT